MVYIQQHCAVCPPGAQASNSSALGVGTVRVPSCTINCTSVFLSCIFNLDLRVKFNGLTKVASKPETWFASKPEHVFELYSQFRLKVDFSHAVLLAIFNEI